MEPILSVENLEYRRDAGFTLRIGHLELLPGRSYCLLGPNGAGKSSLLKLLALLDSPHAGRILYRGEAVECEAQRHRIRRRITLVEQAPLLFDASVYQNLAFGLRLRDVRGELQRLRIEKALRALGLEGFGHRRARELSGGQAKRVALARALVIRPQVLLLDEPAEGLDRDSLPLFEHSLNGLRAEGVTIVAATHDNLQPGRLGAEVLRMEAGRLLESPECQGYPGDFCLQERT